jgi:ribosomal protein S16
VYDDQLFALMTAAMPSHVIICDSAKNPADAETIQTIGFYDPVILQTKDGEIHLTISEGTIRNSNENP